MAYWGIAYAMGPNYNKPWEAFDEAETAKTLSEAYDATMSAAALAGRGTQSERDLIEGASPALSVCTTVAGPGRLGR